MESWNKGKVLNCVCTWSELMVVMTPKINEKESIVFIQVIKVAILGRYQIYSCEMRTKV